MILACNGCDWVGMRSEAVYFKHDASALFCPECNETVEEVTAKWFRELRDDFGNLLSAAEQALLCVDFDNRKLLSLAGLRVLKNGVEYHHEQTEGH